MGLTNLTFFLFVIASLIIYYILPKKYSYISLFISSVFFLTYKDFSILKLIYILIIYLTSFIGSFILNKNIKHKKLVLIVSILIILGELTYLKYTNLFITTINILFKTNIDLITTNAPMGLSYYSLMMIAFLVSSYYGETKENNPIKLGIFMIFFPTITSGPFIKYEDLKGTLDERNKFNIDNIINGFIRVLFGLFKVLVISTRLNIFVTEVYGNVSNYNPLIIFLAIISYTFELYTNFSGSIDIVIGVAKMFGITLPENFKNPFASTTITEFWRVWHITLGDFLRNYIFYPLLKSNAMQKLTKVCKDKFGKKGKKIPVFISMFILWTLIGIWHGGEYKYILASGLLQFIFIFFEDIFGSVNKKRSKAGKCLAILKTFILFSLSMVFFRANTISEGLEILKNLFIFKGTMNVTILSVSNIIITVVSLIILILVDSLWDKIKETLEGKLELRLIVIGVLILVTLLFGMYGLNFVADAFIYGKF